MPLRPAPQVPRHPDRSDTAAQGGQGTVHLVRLHMVFGVIALTAAQIVRLMC